MDKSTATKLIKGTFQNPFDKDSFVYFIQNLLNLDRNQIENKHPYSGNYIPDAYKKYISTLERVNKYQDPEGKELDILIVRLKKESSLEHARTMQRNFIAWYLNGSRGGKLKEAALVAFVAPNGKDWRFSLVKMEYKLGKTQTGRVRAKEELTPARRYSFLVGVNESSHTAQSQLVPILEDDVNNPTFKQLEESFNIEKVTKKFFEKYRELYHWANEELDTIINRNSAIKKDFNEKDIRTVDFAKKLLGQIVFLYFLQKKGWFGVKRGEKWGSGSKGFLRELFEKKHCDYSNFFNDILEPLFHEALRNDRSYDDHYFSMFKCKIPFLNGGLFDPINNYDWKETDILLPNVIFSNGIKTKEGDIGTGILDIFDRYNFTVKEDEPLEKEVAVDPEMLGKVFENLLEVKDRKSKGTYYTPREIVHYMCQESLINYLDSAINTQAATYQELGDKQIQIFGNKVRQGQQKLEKENRNVLVPKEDIEILIKYGETVVEHEAEVISRGNETKTYFYKLPKSVRDNAGLLNEKLASIRVCDPAVGSGAFLVGMMNEIIRTRNALMSYFKNKRDKTIYNFKRHAIQNCLYGVDIDSGAVEIAKLRLWLSLIVDETDINDIRPLPNLDYKIVCGNSLLGVEKNLFNQQLFAKLEELKPLFFSETNISKKHEYKKQIDEIINQITNGRKDFDFEVYFSEIFHEKKGFDVVIANPPYDEISNKQDKNLFQKLYHEVLSGHYDLYIFFFKRAFDIANRGGIISFITPHTYIHYPQFINLRKYIYEGGHILEITNRISGIFESAVVDNSIILIRKDGETDKITKFSYKSIENGNLNDVECFLLKRKDFDFTNFDIRAIKNKKIFRRYLDGTKPLGDITNSSQGITVYAKVQGKKKNWFRSEMVDENSKPIIKGRDIHSYYLKWSGEYIQYGDWLWCPRDTKFFENEKLFFRQTADSLIGTYWREPMYCLDSAHSIIGLQDQKSYDLKYVLAILNSSLGNFLYKLLITETGKVFAQVKLTFLRQIPIKVTTHAQQKPFTELVDKILAIAKDDDYLKNSTKQANVHDYEKQIDQMVYKLYGLTKEEIKVVEGQNNDKKN